MTTAISGSGVTFADSSVQTTAPQQYAKNKIINGTMDIAQRGTSFVGAAAVNVYTLDRFTCQLASTAVVNVAQQADAPSNNEFQNSFRVTVTTADASIAAGEGCNIEHRIEGYNARDLIGETFTLSFWVRSSKTGVHCAAFKNAGVSGNNADRSYVMEYTVSAANTWEYKSVTVSGGLITAGTWNWTNGTGLQVCFTLAAGSTTQTTANSWQTGLFNATANQVNCLDTVGNIFAITGVQLEVGSVATSFEHRPYGAELALCQRYGYSLLTGTPFALAWVTTSASFQGGALTHPVTMRAAPTVLGVTSFTIQGLTATATGFGYGGSNAYHLILSSASQNGATSGALYQVINNQTGFATAEL